MNKELNELLNSVLNLKKETKDLNLKKIHATTHCKYSEIECRLQILKENQEIILNSIKSLNTKSEVLSKEQFILSLIYYFADLNDIATIKTIKEKGIPHTLIIGGNKTTFEKHPYTNIQVVTDIEVGEMKLFW